MEIITKYLYDTIADPIEVPSAQITSSYVRHGQEGTRTSISIEFPGEPPAWMLGSISRLCRVRLEPVDIASPESAWATFLVAYTPTEPTP